MHNSLENPSKKEKKYIENQGRTNDKINESTWDEFFDTVETVVNDTINIENDGPTANGNNKKSNTTTTNSTEGDENENSDIDASKPS